MNSRTSALWHSVRESIVVVLAVGLIMPATAAAPMVMRASPGYFRVMVGDFELTALYDGGGEIDAKLLHAQPEDVQSLVREELEDPEHIRGAVVGFLVNTGPKLILVDAGTGGHWGGPALGKLVSNLNPSRHPPHQLSPVLLTLLPSHHLAV